jgi:hypothetical protein
MEITMTDTQPPMPPTPYRWIPPLWSIALMLFGVIIVIISLIGSLYLIRRPTPQEAAPQVIVQTASSIELAALLPEATVPAVAPMSPATSTPQVPFFTLLGPTLAPVYLSPTPDTISIGRMVMVQNVGENGLNVRSAPGIDNALIFTARENALLEVIAGPATARNDSYTWWHVRDLFTNEDGWAVDLYMQVQPPEVTP